MAPLIYVVVFPSKKEFYLINNKTLKSSFSIEDLIKRMSTMIIKYIKNTSSDIVIRKPEI
jgi:hypothetical protein